MVKASRVSGGMSEHVFIIIGSHDDDESVNKGN